jgi:hypothetical protein
LSFERKLTNRIRGDERAIEKQHFGPTREGASVDMFMLKNRHGIRVRIMPYGAIVVSLEMPDREGQRSDISCLVTMGWKATSNGILISFSAVYAIPMLFASSFCGA